MNSESALMFVSSLLTYLLKSTAAYLFLCLLARLIRNAHIRFRLYGLFLVTAGATWLYLLLSFGLGVRESMRGADGVISARHFSVSLDPALLPALAKGISLASWGYGIILVLLLARFCGDSWQLRKFLRTSQLPPDALSFLFDLVRSRKGSPLCGLWLVEDLRSPATTGWWHPKVLLPRDLLPRLSAQQLVHVLHHELIHVRRRDYLWDRLSTLGCYLIFFHPAAWLARHRLRWERELVCDEGAAPRSGEARLEYASCLTTLANWWFVEGQPAGQIDFLSSPPSLLAARIGALLNEPSPDGSCRKTALTVFAAGALAVCTSWAPQFAIFSSRTPTLDFARNQLLPHPKQVAGGIKRAHVSRTRKPDRFILPTAAFASSATPLNLNFPVVVPVLSSSTSTVTTNSLSRAGASGSPDALNANVVSRDELQSASKVWDESPPQTPRRRASKIGSVALRVLKLGIGVAASQIGDHEHEREH